ncbi:MAG: helix-turn-helix domain-containing protein [Pseudomonadota bacterium]
MTSIPAKNLTSQSNSSSGSAPAPLQVVFIIYPDIVLLDLAGPLQVFAGARHEGGGGPLAYQTAIASVAGGRIQTDTVVSIDTEPMQSWLKRDIHTLVVVGGNGANAVMEDRKFTHDIARLAARAQRICSVCSGALILAAAGLLDGRRAATHWQDCSDLAQGFPKVRVEPDPIYIKDGPIWTSAGVSAGTDMALAMVAEDLGPEAALDLAQGLVTYMVRPGGQSQFSPALKRQKLDRSGRFQALHDWIGENLGHDLRTVRLAEVAMMSSRSFHRLYRTTMGMTPAKAVEAIRMEAARNLLETTDKRVKTVARQCGFKDEERMRRAFMRRLNVTPSDYRQRFRMSERTVRSY